MSHARQDRRRFVRHCVMGGCAMALGAYTLQDLLRNERRGGLRVGYRNDAPEQLWQWSREADWYDTADDMVRCLLCPHECILGENDRGLCRVRVVKDAKLHTIVHGNPCAVHVDPIEKKPLYHFLPGAPILSVATAGCNLSCLNCQNWEISQSKPEETRNHDLPPERLVQETVERGIPAIAYTYSEPIVFYEYVRDTAELARERDIRNVLVTAGYISEKPLRELCRVVDAANVDFKSFSERFYKRIAGAKLKPVQRSLEVMMEEGVWLEVTRLMIPTHSDDPEDVRAMCDWLVRVLGPDVPLHLSRFHPAYQLQGLPPTSVEALGRAYDVARESGLRHVYVGNVPGHEAQHTLCPSCGSTVVTRRGYSTPRVSLSEGRCACGEPIAGVWS